MEGRHGFRLLLNAAVVVGAVLSFLPSLLGQSPARITQPVDSKAVVRVSRTSHPLIKVANDRGRVSADLPMERMVLVLQPSPAQQAAMKNLLDAQQDKASTLYHHWLTPEEFGAQFGPSASDLNQVTAWLQQQGFEVGPAARGKQWIEFSGTAKSVELAFHTEMHHYEFKGEKHVANNSDIALPQALSPVVAGVLSLNDFRKRPARSAGYPVHRDNVTGKLIPSYTHVTDNGTFHYLVPGDYARIYNTEPLLKAGMDGSGISIAIVGRSDINLSDVQFFRQIFSLPANDPVFITSGRDPGVLLGDDVESSLDVEWAGATAPNATIKFVNAASTFSSDGTDLAESYIVDNAIAPIMSSSYGLCEAFLGAAGNAFQDGLLQQAAAEGITTFVASGDNGPAGCDLPGLGEPAIFGPLVNGAASTPYTVTVGGTQFNENGLEGNYWLANNRPDLSSVLGYIPEAVWNESCDPTTDPNFCSGTGQYNLFASSGGPSNCTDSTITIDQITGLPIITCKGHYDKPSWQAGIGVPNDNTRDLPDLSLAAAAQHDGYLICVEGSCQATESNGQTLLTNAFVVGGTSASAPSMAGIMALLEQRNGEFQGLANYQLYQLAAAENLKGCNSSKLTNPNSSSSCVFYDVTSGNNSVPGQPGYSAGKGYDMSTGLGSVNAANLVAAWGSASKLQSTTSLTSGLATAQHGQPFPLNVTVKPAVGGGSPSGDFSLLTRNGSVFGGTLSHGTFSGSVTNLPGGKYDLTARYGGNAMFAGSDSNQAGISITPEPSVAHATLWTILEANFPVPVTFPVSYGAPLAIELNLGGKSGIGFPTGTVKLTLDGETDLGNFPLNSRGNLNVDLSTTNVRPGRHAFRAMYGGDQSFMPISIEAPLQERKGMPVIYADAGPSTVTAGSPVVVFMSVGGGGADVPTGTVTLLDNGRKIAGPFNLGGNGEHLAGLRQARCKVTLPVGNHFLTTRYSGDSNYQTSGIFHFGTDVTVNAPSGAPTQVVLHASAPSVLLGQSVNYVVTVRSTNPGGPLPTGSVTLVGQDGLVQAGPSSLTNGNATFTIPLYQGGQYLFNASYSGDSTYGPSNSPNSILTTVNMAMPLVSVSAAAPVVNATVPTSLTVTVTGDPKNQNLSIPSGQVEFFDSFNGAPARRLAPPQFLTLGNGNIGIYTLPVILPAGTHAIHAKYLGSVSASFGTSIDWHPADSNQITVVSQ